MRALVYRVQDKEGRGPWHPGFSHRWVEDRPDHENLGPIYADPGCPDMGCLTGFVAYGVACRTVEQLRRWFTPSEYAKLCMFGYQCVSMYADRVMFDTGTQCLFGRMLPLRFDAMPVDLYHQEGADHEQG